MMTHEIRPHATESSSFSDMGGNENTDLTTRKKCVHFLMKMQLNG